MQLDSMKPAPGSRKARKRKGRGPGSGNGKTAGRGHKGQGSRAGGGTPPGFEGGQMPLARRLPKRGFHNRNRVEFEVVNLDALSEFEAGTTVDPELLTETRHVRRRLPVKILANGEISVALTVRAHAFSDAAKTAIEAAGGKAEVLERLAAEAAESAE